MTKELEAITLTVQRKDYTITVDQNVTAGSETGGTVVMKLTVPNGTAMALSDSTVGNNGAILRRTGASGWAAQLLCEPTARALFGCWAADPSFAVAVGGEDAGDGAHRNLGQQRLLLAVHGLSVL